ncbi:hypothetical protein N658DRAFT_498392 [Parathielavia hyrcaniae]|uniref:Uncharacterized protein n=1 Tax=Parathielavia hyrcaniae TaxID=113614 RepID=A0AAN6T077_9PEZI|nr:hypothetical protein N658DRAFT_498392 [Parathielavia hyrcaniae]
MVGSLQELATKNSSETPTARDSGITFHARKAFINQPFEGQAPFSNPSLTNWSGQRPESALLTSETMPHLSISQTKRLQEWHQTNPAPSSPRATLEPCNERLSGNRTCVERILGLDNAIKAVYVGIREPDIFIQQTMASSDRRTLGSRWCCWMTTRNSERSSWRQPLPVMRSRVDAQKLGSIGWWQFSREISGLQEMFDGNCHFRKR